MWKQREFIYRCPASTAWDREFFYSTMYPPNLTVEWIDTDQPNRAISQEKIEYKFNEYGFRSDSFDDRSEINVLVSGCSLTVGVGVNENWAMKLRLKLEALTNKKVTVWNIATSGASSDYTVRSISKVYHLLDPDYIFIYWPPMSRLELPDPTHPTRLWQSHINDPTFHKDFVNDEFLRAQQTKNKVFAKTTIPQSLLRLYYNDKDVNFTDGFARDGQHPNEAWHEEVAEMFLKKLDAQTKNPLFAEYIDDYVIKR